MVLYDSLRAEKFDQRAELFVRTLDAEVWDAYGKDEITARGGCLLVAERIRAAGLGLPQPELVRRSQPHQPVYRDSALTTFQNWLDHYRDYEKAQAEIAAAKQDWEDFRWGVLYDVMHRPIRQWEKAEIGTRSGRRRWDPRRDAWEDWLEEMWSQRNRRERQEAQAAMFRRLDQLLEVGQEEDSTDPVEQAQSDETSAPWATGDAPTAPAESSPPGPVTATAVEPPAPVPREQGQPYLTR
jgi:hypothetical protein